MKRSFVKMHGCGNDYIYFDCMEQPLQHPEAWAVRLSDRHKGIGGDGLVMILPEEGADGRMRMFNADGSEGKMCGNAIRCVGKYLYDKGYAKKEQLCIQTLSGPKTLHMTVENGQAVAAKVDMGPAEFSAEKDSRGAADGSGDRPSGYHWRKADPHYLRIHGQSALCGVCGGCEDAAANRNRPEI